MLLIRPYAVLAVVLATLVAPSVPRPAAAGAITALFPEYVVSDTSLASQTKASVTITLRPLGPSHLYEHPELFEFDRATMPQQITGFGRFAQEFDRDYLGKDWCYTFGVDENQLAVFLVEVRNGTDHILRMRDARIFIEVEGHDPIAPVTKLGDPTLVPTTEAQSIWTVAPRSALLADESVVHWVTYWEQEAERQRKKSRFLDDVNRVPRGVRSQVIARNRAAYKLIGDVSAEILPGRSSRGILLFPVTATFDTARVSFYDIQTKVDAAGTPTEKQTFGFPVRLTRVQMIWDGKRERRWQRM